MKIQTNKGVSKTRSRGRGLLFFFFFLSFFLLFLFLFFCFFAVFFSFGTNRESRAEYHGMVFNHFSRYNGHVINHHFSHVGRTNSIMEGGGGVHGKFLHILV